MHLIALNLLHLKTIVKKQTNVGGKITTYFYIVMLHQSEVSDDEFSFS